MLGQIYERALNGECCRIRYDHGEVFVLPVGQWLGGRDADEPFDTAVVQMCEGPTIELGCGPGRLVDTLTRRGIRALGVDQSEAAIRLARRRGTPVLHGDVFGPLPELGRWETVLLIDGTVGLGGDPQRILTVAAQLLQRGGQCLAEVDPTVIGVRVSQVRLESDDAVGEWFPWATVGVDSAALLAERAGLVLTGIHQHGDRVIASMTAVS
ncbi:class I SAM-dependent methyltransferase [soil metagenome]